MEDFWGAPTALKAASLGVWTADIICVPGRNLTVALLKPLRQMLLVSSGDSEGLFPKGSVSAFPREVDGTPTYTPSVPVGLHLTISKLDTFKETD